jgi:hypothetical protein
MTNRVYRTTITIPQKLKDEMDALGAQVNWSAVAAEAFQRKVAEVRSGREKATMKQKVIERLRKAGQADQQGFEAGQAAGRKWAEEKALPRHLRAIENAEEAYVTDEDEEHGWSASENLAHAITAMNDMYECRAFWDDAIGPKGSNLMEVEDFAHGFIAGAREVWDEVKGDL